jgi:GNAT superfamily N-acetyltransferase
MPGARLPTIESPLIFLPFDPSQAEEGEINLRAKQIHFFMEEEVNSFYGLPVSEGGLGLRYIDETPYTIDDRARLLRESGPVQSVLREYLLAFEATEAGTSSNETALKGLVVLKKPDGPCTAERHTPTEIAEFDLAKTYRGRGLGTVMMGAAIQRIGHDERVVLDVARPNIVAQGVYLHRSFVFTDAPPVRHGVHDVDHLEMATTTSEIVRTLPDAVGGQWNPDSNR